MTGSRFTTRFIWHVQAWAFFVPDPAVRRVSAPRTNLCAIARQHVTTDRVEAHQAKLARLARRTSGLPGDDHFNANNTAPTGAEISVLMGPGSGRRHPEKRMYR